MSVPTSVALERDATRLSWLPMTLVLGAFFGAFALLWPTTLSLLSEWEDTNKTTYTHGYLIALISLWMLWHNRANLSAQRSQPNLTALLALAAASVLWLAVFRSGLQLAHQLLLPAMIWLAVCAMLGIRVALACSVAIGYLYFAIPIWDEGNVVLQSATTQMVSLLLRVTGVPAYVEGNNVHLAAGSFEIAGGCSGLHFFIVGLALGALYGEVHRDRWSTRLRLLLLVLGLALLTNWLRVYIIIVAGYLTDMQHYLVRVEHYRFGWVVFAAAMTVFFLIARRLPSEPAAAANPAAATVAPALKQWSMVAAALLALTIGPLWDVLDPTVSTTLEARNGLPIGLSGWRGPSDAADADWRPVFVGADLEQHGRYWRLDATTPSGVDAYVAAYATQEQGKELVSYSNSILGPVQDSVVARSKLEADGPVAEVVGESRQGERWIVWYFYQVGSSQTASGIEAQLRYGVASLFGSPVSRVVALRSRCVPDCDATRRELDTLLRTSGFELPLN